VAYALNFNDKDGANLFKVFLGRNDAGEVFSDQKYRFDLLMTSSELFGAPTDEK
jgi:putative heme iron utilization protein